MQNGTASLENILVAPQKLITELPYNSAIHFSNTLKSIENVMFPQNLHMNVYSSIIQTWKQSNVQ